VLQAEGTESSVKVLNGDGKAQVIKP
jgi:hypothetical protein